MQQLLSKEEIEFIINDSKNRDYKIENLFHPSFHKTDIMKVSKASELILFYGNESTGFLHLHERHSNVSLKPFWKGNNKLETPSKFHNNIIPFFHYVNVAEEVFNDENLNISQNTNVENFDLYIGESSVTGATEKYRLLLYKNTKIIHTLFPESKINNLKLNTGSYARGSVSLSSNFENSETILTIPYNNSENQIVYEIAIIYKELQHDKLVVIKKYENGQIIKEKEIERSKFTYNLNAILLLSKQFENFKDYESKFGKL
jgi:hypothetical protein